MKNTMLTTLTALAIVSFVGCTPTEDDLKNAVGNTLTEDAGSVSMNGDITQVFKVFKTNGKSISLYTNNTLTVASIKDFAELQNENNYFTFTIPVTSTSISDIQNANIVTLIAYKKDGNVYTETNSSVTITEATNTNGTITIYGSFNASLENNASSSDTRYVSVTFTDVQLTSATAL